MNAAEVIAALDALPTDDCEVAHSEADRLLLQCVSDEVAAAYFRVADRCRWWAFA